MDTSDEEYVEPSLVPKEHKAKKRTNQENTGYSWEDEYQRTWDIVKDDDSRSLEAIIQGMIEGRKKKIMKLSTSPYQRGIIRTMVVIIDGSSIMSEKDLRPTRFSLMLQYLQEFIVEFFDQNPISQLGVVLMRNGISHVVSEVNGSPQYHIDKIRGLRSRQHNRFEPKGDPSLQNSLELARSLLKYNFGNNINDSKNSKEILIIFGALFTSDPGDIHETINSLVKDKIRVKVIGLSAQVAICQELVTKTNHTKNLNYGVIMNETHFKELLMDCVIPLAITKDLAPKVNEEKVPLMKMGFPTKIQPVTTSNLEPLHFCACHPTRGSDDTKNVVEIQLNVSNIGYKCPQCFSRVCSLPTVCPVCGLMLILSTHLARSYHHLVPLSEYKEVPKNDEGVYDSQWCFGCLLKFEDGLGSSRYKCGECKNDFCIDCDVFVHEILHNCPGCQ